MDVLREKVVLPNGQSISLEELLQKNTEEELEVIWAGKVTHPDEILFNSF